MSDFPTWQCYLCTHNNLILWWGINGYNWNCKTSTQIILNIRLIMKLNDELSKGQSEPDLILLSLCQVAADWYAANCDDWCQSEDDWKIIHLVIIMFYIIIITTINAIWHLKISIPEFHNNVDEITIFLLFLDERFTPILSLYVYGTNIILGMSSLFYMYVYFICMFISYVCLFYMYVYFICMFILYVCL